MTRLRPIVLALPLAFALANGGGAVPAASAAPPDTAGVLTPWTLHPASPCVRDSLVLVVRGFEATPCDSFLGAEALGPLRVRIRRQVRVDAQCISPPVHFYPVPVPLGRFTAGAHAGVVEVEVIERGGDGSTTRRVESYPFAFTVAAECPVLPPPPAGPLPFVRTIGTEPARPCSGRPTSLVLEGVFNDGCGRVVDARVVHPGQVELTLKTGVLADTVCTAAIEPWRQALDLGDLPPGPHRVGITLRVVRPDSTGTGFVRETFHGGHEFHVFADCGPDPAPGPLPYVKYIAVGPGGICGPAPICPGDSIPVTVGGIFPHDCLRLRRVELLPSITPVFPAPPPTVRVIVDDGCCLGRPCRNVPVPWSASLRLPPLAAGDHRLRVELAEVCCSDSVPPGALHGTEVPFAVARECPPPPVCLLPEFAPGPGGTNACNATVSGQEPARLTFRVSPTVALAGLQGAFRLEPPGLMVTGIAAIGPAEGMLLDWTPTADGARFVLIATRGAPIPPGSPEAGPSPRGWPVLHLTVAPRGGPGIPDRTVVTTEDLLGSDIAGGAVPVCPPLPCADRDFRLTPGRAVICAGRPCDLNDDGTQDIRDLVLMVRCVTGEAVCPPDAPTRFDCDGDGTLAIADVLCCARHVLGRPPCPDCPPDTLRPEPGVAVSFGDPAPLAGGVAVTLRIADWERVGGLMLTLDAPLDRYDVAGFAMDPPGTWLALHEVRDGRLVLGLIDLHDRRSLALRTAPVPTLVLALRPGRAAGGELAVVGGEFSGPDGVALEVELGRPARTLPGGAPFALGPSRPNPFSSETAFTLDLDREATVTVGIYDLRGRVVATLHRAPLAPGPHTFRWNGRSADGSTAANGIYFYQATVDGRSLARKLIRMRGD